MPLRGTCLRTSIDVLLCHHHQPHPLHQNHFGSFSVWIFSHEASFALFYNPLEDHPNQ